jgi:ABC-type sugar transport system substrate-binding protein
MTAAYIVEVFMRKLTLFILILAMLAAMGACGADPTSAEISASPSVTPNDVDDVEMPAQPQIGFSLAGEGAFYDQLTKDIEAACATLDYEANIVAADSGDKQKSDIRSMLSAGAAVIVIDPVDVDALETVLAECETSGVPVINIIDSINGLVSTLISPDYIEIGKNAGQRAVSLYGEQQGKCLELKTGYDSFIMQLMSDGFNSAISEDSDVSLTTEKYCGNDEEKAYQAAKNDLWLNDTTFIFAQSAALARGAMRAIEESGKEVSLVVYGGDMDIIEAVSAGKVNMAMFIDTAQIVQKAVADADSFIKNASYAPLPYQKLDVYTVTADNAADYVSADNLYAKEPV